MTHPITQQRRGGLFPVALQHLTERVTKPAFKQYGIAEARLVSEWELVVGKVLAEKTLPIRIQFAQGSRNNGILHIVAESGWALEIQHLEPVILEKIATFFGYRAIGRIRITQAPLPLKKTLRKVDAPPLPKIEREKLEKTVEYVENEAVRAALICLGEAVLHAPRSKQR